MRRRNRKRTSPKPVGAFVDELRSLAYEVNLYGLRTPGDVAQIVRRVSHTIGSVLHSLQADYLDDAGWMRIALMLEPATEATRIAQSIAEREAARLLSRPKHLRRRLLAITQQQSRDDNPAPRRRRRVSG